MIGVVTSRSAQRADALGLAGAGRLPFQPAFFPAIDVEQLALTAESVERGAGAVARYDALRVRHAAAVMAFRDAQADAVDLIADQAGAEGEYRDELRAAIRADRADRANLPKPEAPNAAHMEAEREVVLEIVGQRALDLCAVVRDALAADIRRDRDALFAMAAEARNVMPYGTSKAEAARVAADAIQLFLTFTSEARNVLMDVDELETSARALLSPETVA